MQKIKNKIMGLFGLFSNKKKETLDKGLEKTKESVFGKLARAVAGKSTVDMMCSTISKRYSSLQT